MAALSSVGLDRLLERLEQAEPGGRRVSEEVVRLTLQRARSEGRPFDEAWLSARCRLQPPNRAGVSVNDRITADLLEERALLDELRPYFQAFYEGRPITKRERDEHFFLSAPRLEGRAIVRTLPVPGVAEQVVSPAA